jgi:hypothetical protein
MAMAGWTCWGLRARRVAVSLVAAAVLAGCASTATSPGSAASARPGTSQGKVILLTRISTLRSLFNREQGHTRLVLIFSPT